MIHILKTFTSIVLNKSCIIDSVIFKLHYKYSTLILILACSMQFYSKLFGEAIVCDVSEAVPTQVFNSYCLINGTTNLPFLEPSTEHLPKNAPKKFYQWIVFILFFQVSMTP